MSPLVGLHLQGIRLRKLGPMRLMAARTGPRPSRSRSCRSHRRHGSCSHRWLRWRCCCRRLQTRSCHRRRRWTDQAMIRPPPAGAATDPRRPGTRPRCSTRTLSTIESKRRKREPATGLRGEKPVHPGPEGVVVCERSRGFSDRATAPQDRLERVEGDPLGCLECDWVGELVRLPPEHVAHKVRVETHR
jgi:hypothetical protein